MRVFISHQWRDKQVADQLRNRLDAIGGFDVWIDYRNLRPGDPIQDSIDEVLAEMDVMLVVWSEHSAASTGVAAEIAAAERLQLRTIPCFITYDETGAVVPPIEGPLARYLGIDFHHFETGLASLASLLAELQRERDGASVDDDPRLAMLHRMREAASYLANYRNVKGVDDDRRYWVDQIVSEIERYVDETGDTALAAQFAAGIELIRDDDPEAYETAMVRLGPLLDGHTTPEGSSDVAPVEPVPDSGWEPTTPPTEMLDQVLASSGISEHDQAGVRTLVRAYHANAMPALEAMAAAVVTAQSAAGMQVVQYLNGYLERGDDVIPDHHGLYGQLDDAWLILNTAFRLIESGALTAAQVPIDWQTVMSADAAVRALIPPPAMAALEQQMMQLLQLIANEINAYQPWMSPTADGGYSPTAAWGSSWEDQMAQGMAELGISF